MRRNTIIHGDCLYCARPIGVSGASVLAEPKRWPSPLSRLALEAIVSARIPVDDGGRESAANAA